MLCQSSIWTVLLAGGDGTRLRGQWVAGERVDRPKQFCRFGRGRSLLGATLHRARALTDSSHTVLVVSREHRDWWEPEVRDIPRENVLVQPANRGTGVAVLHALVHILRQEDSPTVVTFPCDHGVDNELELLIGLCTLVRAAERHRRDLVLLGACPDRPETQYGWILPDAAFEEAPRVRAFVEKPPLETAASLMCRNALWNTFLLAGAGAALLERYFRVASEFAHSYFSRMSADGWSDHELTEFYRVIDDLDFGRDLLQPSAAGLRVVPLPACGWTDLGTAERAESWIRSRRSEQGLEGSPLDLKV